MKKILEYHKIKICEKNYNFICKRTEEINNKKYIPFEYDVWLKQIQKFKNSEYIIFCVNNFIIFNGNSLNNFIIAYKEKNKKLKMNYHHPITLKYYNDYKLKKRKEKIKILKRK